MIGIFFGSPANAFRCLFDTSGQNVAKSLSLGNLPDHGFHGLGVTPLEIDSAGIFYGQNLSLEEFHGKGDHTAGGNCIHSKDVAQIAQVHQGFRIGETAQSTQVDDGFIFGPPAFKPLIAIPFQLDFCFAAYGTAMAPALLFDELVQLPAVDLLHFVELILLIISGSQHAHLVGLYDIPGRSVSGIIPVT